MTNTIRYRYDIDALGIEAEPGGGFSLLKDFGPWHRVEELLEGFLGD